MNKIKPNCDKNRLSPETHDLIIFILRVKFVLGECLNIWGSWNKTNLKYNDKPEFTVILKSK